MGNDTWAIIAIIAYGIASIADLLMTRKAMRYGLKESNKLYRDKNGGFVWWRYVLVSAGALLLLMFGAFPYWPVVAIIAIFGMAAYRLVVALVWTPSQIRKAEQGRVVTRFRGQQL